MSATASLVKVLSDAGFAEGRVFDLRVPEQTLKAGPDFIWLGRGGSEDDGCLTDTQEWRQFIDLEFWGKPEADPQTGADEVRAFLQNYPPGTFGDGRVAAVRVTDQRDEYELRNAARDDYMVNGLLAVTLYNYREP